MKKTRIRDKIHGIIDRVYFKESEGLSVEKRKIRFHCVAWGGHLDTFFAYTLPSLLQDGNIPSLTRDGYELELDIYAHNQEYQEIAQRNESCLALAKEHMPVNLIPLDELKSGVWRGYHLRSAFNHQVKRCLDENAMMFIAGPDLIYGNRTITNAVSMIKGKNVCLAAGPPSIGESILTSDAITGMRRMERVVENDELVDLAFEHGEPPLQDFYDCEDSNKTHGGVSIRKINDNTYSVIHNRIGPYLANFIKSDLKYFVGSGSHWSTAWMRVLLRQNRLKVVGSSDLFFCVKLTTKERSNPDMRRGFLYNDKFFPRSQRYLQQYVFNSFCCVWKGRGKESRLQEESEQPM